MTPNDESLTPETVDEYIERLLNLRDDAPADQDTRPDLDLIRKLRHAYETEEANERSLERVWERLAQRSAAPSPTQTVKPQQTHRMLFLRKRQVAMNRPPVQYPIRPRFSYRLGAIVAAILIALLIGGLVIGLILVRQVPHQSVGGNPTTTITATTTAMPTPQPSDTSTATLTPTPSATLPPAPTATPLPQGPLLTYTGHSGPIRTLAWSPNGKWIASAGDDTTVQVWNALTGQPIFTFRQHTQAVNALAWSPDSTRIVSASGNENGPPKSQVFVWNATTGKVLLTYTNNPTQVNGGIIRYLAWSPDGTRILSRGDDGTLQIWNPTDGTVLLSLQAGGPVAWSPDSRRFASGNGFGIDIRDASTGAVIASFPGQGSSATGLAWSPDGSRIVVGDGFGVIHILDATNAQPLLTYQGFSGSYESLCMAWSPDSKRVATGGMGVGQNVNTVQVWDSTSGQTLATFGGQPQGVNAVSWSPNGADIAAGGQDGTIQIWKAP